jgi:hypothetical protein
MLSYTSRLSLALKGFKENPSSTLRRGATHATNGLRTTGIFLKTCYVDGFRALLAGHYSRRQAAVIMCATMPTILGALMITVPGLLFPSPGHQAFYHFAETLGRDPTSLIPVILGTISSTLGLKIPLG